MDNNKSQFFSTKKEIIKWLDKNYINSYTINNDLSVDVYGNVIILRMRMKFIPIKFGNVTGSFWCYSNALTDLAGSPKSVGGNFFCCNNRLISGADFFNTYIDGGGMAILGLNKKIFKDKELYNFLNKYFNNQNDRVEIEFKVLKFYLEKLELEKNLKISDNIKSKKITKNSYL